MSEKTFLGVYSRSTAKGVAHYFAWSEGDSYSVQKLDTDLKPLDSLSRVDPFSFSSYFVFIPELTEKIGDKQNFEAVQQDSSHMNELGKGQGKNVSFQPFSFRRKTSATEEYPVRYAPARPRASVDIENLKNIQKEVCETLVREVGEKLNEDFFEAFERLKDEYLKEKAEEDMRSIAAREEGVVPEHKHLFANFGSHLRKENELSIALAFCERVIQLSPEDDHGYFNLARIHIELQEYEKAKYYLDLALEVEPSNIIYVRAWKYVTKCLELIMEEEAE